MKDFAPAFGRGGCPGNLRNLAGSGLAADYAKAEKALNDYFIPKVNCTYQNHVFCCMEQQDGETVSQFVTRLKQVVKDCDYGDQSGNLIRDQGVQRSKSLALRRKLLEKGENLTLALLLTTVATYEAVQSQLESMEDGQHTVNLIRDSRREAQQRKGKEPGKGLKEAQKIVRYVQDVDEDEDEYAFIVKSASQPGKIEVFSGGILVEMLVDSGARTNVIDKHLW